MKAIPRFSFPFFAALALALFLAGHGRSAAAEPFPEKVAIPTRDGVKLATDVYRPATNTPLPVILARTPYNKDGLRGFARDGLGRGYAEVTGNVRAKLWVSTDVPDSDFIVRLCDVYPDGRSFNLCEGILRARFRSGFDQEKLLQPGRVYPLEIDLWPISIIFNRGHRIRLHVTSSSAPGFDPNPNTGEPFRASTRTRVAHHAVHIDSRRPSHVLLPIPK